MRYDLDDMGSEDDDYILEEITEAELKGFYDVEKDEITLDGTFKIAELEALLNFMKGK